VVSHTAPEVGERIFFNCNGRGRGNHYLVTAIVTRVHRKTVEATEAEKSYSPGTRWRVAISDLKPYHFPPR
jgi:hypothetical protein